MLLVSAVTLAVAALALLSPFEQRLRNDSVRTVQAAIGSVKTEFSDIPLERSGNPEADELRRVEDQLRRRTGGQVTVLDRTLEVLNPPHFRDLNLPDYFRPAREALARHRQVRRIVAQQLIVAQRLTISHRPFVLVVLKRLQYVSEALRVVREATLVAAAAGLGTALLLGLGLTATMLRRLERLREGTARVGSTGLEAPLPVDSGRDEIGELSRAFAAMQSRLRRIEQARRSFVATASHELRTPLASLDGMLELLEDDLREGSLDLPDARARAEHAREQTRRLAKLAADLLDLSRLDSEVQLRSEPLELGEIARAVAAEFELTAAKHDVRIDVASPASPAWTTADPGSVARIVRILLDNALRFAPAGSSVTIEPSRLPRFAQVLVRDEGPGVPGDEREAIFERFTRGSTSTSATESRSGFGLGLAIGRELAQRMGGELALLDGRNGACFALRLPAISTPQQQDQAALR
jgi:signal transduction histidine kinase